MSPDWIFVALMAGFALMLGRSAVIAIWPDSTLGGWLMSHGSFLDDFGVDGGGDSDDGCDGGDD